jgi:hypothetical protein
MNIPKQLAKPEFRFYKVGNSNTKWAKIAIEKSWNTINNYQYNSQRLQDHISQGGNYGIVTGTPIYICGYKHHLIVLDFDNLEFWKDARKHLPDTFIVQTASKKLYHYYYYLKGEPIKKIGVDSKEGERVLDIQSDGAGIVAPGSKIFKSEYKVFNDKPISTISFQYIKTLFHIDKKRKAEFKLHLDKTKSCPEEVKKSIQELKDANIKQTAPQHFTCPLHTSHNKKNLYVGDAGTVYCFNCQRWAKNGSDWIKKYYIKLRM